MKKLVTLSAVTLAGATMGVGSTFGWWAEDSLVPKESVQPADSPASVPTPIESAPTLAPLEVPTAPILNGVEVSGPYDIPGISNPPPAPIPPNVVYRTQPTIQPIVPSGGGILRDDADRLTRELIKEADELEKKGQSEAAEIHRKLISRLQRTPRRVVPVPVQGSTVNMLPALPGMGMPYISPVTIPYSAPNVAGGEPAVRVEYRDVSAIDPLAVSLGQRATHLEHEARQAEEQGQTDVANEKRKLAAQLREIEKLFPTQTRKVAVYQSLPGTPASPAAGVVRASKIQFAPLDPETESKISELAKDFEQDADRLEKEGKKDHAEAKRSAARRIRETLPKVEFGVGKKWVTIEAVAERNPDASAISELDKELLNLKEAVAKTDDPEVRKQLMAKAFALGVKRQVLQANLPKIEIGERKDPLEKEHLDSAIRSLKEDIRNIQSNVEQPEISGTSNHSQPESKPQEKPRDPGEKVSGEKKRQKALAMALYNYAQQLRAQGHRDQAQALLDQANELEHHSLPSVTRSELVPKELQWNKEETKKESRPSSDRKSEVRNGDRILIEKEMRVHGPIKLDGLQKKLATLFPDSTIDLLFVAPNALRINLKARDEDEASRILKISAAEIRIQEGNRDLTEVGKSEQERLPVGAHQSEVQELLRALHHEITELRSEVRDLRSVIKEESRNEKRGAKTDKEANGNEQKDKRSGDQKATETKDESKKPTEDKPQLDD